MLNESYEKETYFFQHSAAYAGKGGVISFATEMYLNLTLLTICLKCHLILTCNTIYYISTTLFAICLQRYVRVQ